MPVYEYWYQTGTTTTAYSTTTSGWTAWATTGTASNVWPYWIASSGTTGGTFDANSVWRTWTILPDAYVETDEQRAEREERQRREAEEYQQHAAEETSRREAAAAKARELLHDHLDAEQREALARRRAFRVIASDGEEYEIAAAGHSGNVRRIVDGRAVERLCVHAYVEGMPDEDHWLEQKLMLEADAEVFRRIANITRVA